MAKKNSVIFLSLIVFALVFAGCGKKEETTQLIEKVSPVEIQVVGSGNIEETTQINGTIFPSREVNIVATMGGKVDQVYVKVGQEVKKDQSLVRLDTEEIEKQVRQAQDGLRTAEAALRVSELSIKPLYDSYMEAKKNLEQVEKMVAQGLATQEQVSTAQKLVNDLEFQYIQATGDPDAPKNKRKNSMQAENGVKQAKNAVEAAQNQVNNANFKSPIKGVVAQKNVNLGDLAGPSIPMIKVIDIDKVVLKINLPESRINNLKLEQKVEVEIAALNQTFEGKVSLVSPQTDVMTKNFPVEITIDNSEHLIKPGMTAKVNIPVKSKEEAIIIPRNALLDKDGIQKVFVVVNEETAIEKTVTLGLRNSEEVEIVSGLANEEVLVIKGHHSLKNNSKVQIKTKGE